MIGSSTMSTDKLSCGVTPGTTPQPRRLDNLFDSSTARHEKLHASVWKNSHDSTNDDFSNASTHLHQGAEYAAAAAWRTADELSPDSKQLFEALEEAQRHQKVIDRENGIPSASSIAFVSKVFPPSAYKDSRCEQVRAPPSSARGISHEMGLQQGSASSFHETPQGIQFKVVKRTLRYTHTANSSTRKGKLQFEGREIPNQGNIFDSGFDATPSQRFSGETPSSSMLLNSENMEGGGLQQPQLYTSSPIWGTSASTVESSVHETPACTGPSGALPGKRLFMTSGKQTTGSSQASRWSNTTPSPGQMSQVSAGSIGRDSVHLVPTSDRRNKSPGSSSTMRFTNSSPAPEPPGSPERRRVLGSASSESSQLLMSPMQPSSSSSRTRSRRMSRTRTPSRITRAMAARLRLDSVSSVEETIVNLVSPNGPTSHSEETLDTTLVHDVHIESFSPDGCQSTSSRCDEELSGSRVKQLRTSPSAINFDLTQDENEQEELSDVQFEGQMVERLERHSENIQQLDGQTENSQQSEQEMMDESERLARQLMMEEEAALLERIQEEQMRMIQQLRDSQGASDDLVMALQIASQDQLESGQNEDEDAGGIDPDEMSYDQLLALGEQIGDVGKEIWRETGQAHVEALCIIPFQDSREEFDNLLAQVDKSKKLTSEFVYADPKCVVCQYTYESGEAIKLLPCGHGFHGECIDGWLVDNKTCVTCKRSIDPNDAE